MPRTIERKRKRPIIEVGEDTLPILIKRGARVVALNKFLGSGYEIPIYMTLIAGPHSHFITYHTRPLPFIVQANGTLIPDGSPNIELRRNAHYHPS